MLDLSAIHISYSITYRKWEWVLDLKTSDLIILQWLLSILKIRYALKKKKHIPVIYLNAMFSKLSNEEII